MSLLARVLLLRSRTRTSSLSSSSLRPLLTVNRTNIRTLLSTRNPVRIHTPHLPPQPQPQRPHSTPRIRFEDKRSDRKGGGGECCWWCWKGWDWIGLEWERGGRLLIKGRERGWEGDGMEGEEGEVVGMEGSVDAWTDWIGSFERADWPVLGTFRLFFEHIQTLLWDRALGSIDSWLLPT